jgi:hypothetical protein
MTWNDAKQAATEWLRELQLPADLKGQSINVKKLAEKLPQQGAFRDMIVRAAIRQLRQRGAKIE